MAEELRVYKDRLFCFLFGSEAHKDWTLSLYNAVNGTHYTDPDAIEIATIRQVVYMGMHNDVAFLISNEVNLYEQQSTYNPNMPLRLLQYTSNIYEKLITLRRENKYGKRLIRLPVPKLVVFYNGTAGQSDETTLRLSDAFDEDRRDSADIAVRVRMINVNAGHSPGVLVACKPLGEYAWLVEQIRRREQEMPLEAAVDAAFDDMPTDYVIRPYLQANRVEVKKMLLTEYNETRQMELFREEGRQEGRREGRQEGRREGRQEGRREGRQEGRQEGRREGRQEGRREGTVIGETRLGALITKLIALGRLKDVERAASDPAYRDELYAEMKVDMGK